MITNAQGNNMQFLKFIVNLFSVCESECPPHQSYFKCSVKC